MIMTQKEINQELWANLTRNPYLDGNVRENVFEEVTFRLRHEVSQVRREREEWFQQRETGAKALRQ